MPLKKSEHPCKDIFYYNDNNPITLNSFDSDVIHTKLNKPKTNPSTRVTH